MKIHKIEYTDDNTPLADDVHIQQGKYYARIIAADDKIILQHGVTMPGRTTHEAEVSFDDLWDWIASHTMGASR